MLLIHMFIVHAVKLRLAKIVLGTLPQVIRKYANSQNIPGNYDAGQCVSTYHKSIKQITKINIII